MYTKSRFSNFSKVSARWAGHPAAFFSAMIIILVWALAGSFFKFSDTWQLTINTGTTVVTFLMVFLIQNTQNRESEAMQIKLDEIIRSLEGAHNALLDIEDLSEHELDQFRKKYQELARKARVEYQKGIRDTDTPEIKIGGE